MIKKFCGCAYSGYDEHGIGTDEVNITLLIDYANQPKLDSCITHLAIHEGEDDKGDKHTIFEHYQVYWTWCTKYYALSQYALFVGQLERATRFYKRAVYYADKLPYAYRQQILEKGFILVL